MNGAESNSDGLKCLAENIGLLGANLRKTLRASRTQCLFNLSGLLSWPGAWDFLPSRWIILALEMRTMPPPPTHTPGSPRDNLQRPRDYRSLHCLSAPDIKLGLWSEGHPKGTFGKMWGSKVMRVVCLFLRQKRSSGEIENYLEDEELSLGHFYFEG